MNCGAQINVTNDDQCLTNQNFVVGKQALFVIDDLRTKSDNCYNYPKFIKFAWVVLIIINKINIPVMKMGYLPGNGGLFGIYLLLINCSHHSKINVLNYELQ